MYPRRSAYPPSLPIPPYPPTPVPPPAHRTYSSRSRSSSTYYDEFTVVSPSISGSTTLAAISEFDSDKVQSQPVQSGSTTTGQERVGRTRLSEMIRKYDERRLRDVKEDIDSLLVFAGLFSAVLTAFLIESYGSLREDPQDTSTQILLRISVQLAALSQTGEGAHILDALSNPTNGGSPFEPPPFSAGSSSIRINTLWSCSLIFSLVTASLGILVKQWLHEYMAHHENQSLGYLRIRFFRNEGLIKWRVLEFAAFLPLLLQVSLVLFFIGLSEYLRGLNPIVGWTASGVMIAWLLVYLFTMLAPMFSEQCPYNTPILKGPVQAIRRQLHLLPYRVLSTYIDVSLFIVEQLYRACSNVSYTVEDHLYNLKYSLDEWEPKREDYLPKGERHIRDKDIADLAILVHSDNLFFLDETSKEMVANCAEELRLDSAVTSLCACLVGTTQGFRRGLTAEDTPSSIWVPVKGLPLHSTESLCRIFFNVIHGEITRLPRLDPKDVLDSLVTLHRSLTVLLSFQSLIHTKAFQHHFPSLLFRMIDYGEHTAVCALLALYSAGNLWLRDPAENFENYLRLDRLKRVLQSSDSGNARTIDSTYVDTLTKTTKYILQTLHPWSTSTSKPPLEVPKEAHAFILRVMAPDKLAHHPVILCFLYGILLKRALPYTSYKSETEIHHLSSDLSRALQKQSLHNTPQLREINPEALYQVFRLASSAFSEAHTSNPGSIDGELIAELRKKSNHLGPAFECVYEIGNAEVDGKMFGI